MRQPPPPPPASQRGYGAPSYQQPQAFTDAGYGPYDRPGYHQGSYPPDQYGEQSFADDIPYQGGYQRPMAHSNQPPPEIAFPAAQSHPQGDHYSYQSNGGGYQDARGQYENRSQLQSAHGDDGVGGVF